MSIRGSRADTRTAARVYYHRREVDEREKDPAFVSDAYAECYPGYHDFNNQVVDSDDEADYTHMDSKLGKSRTEFNTEEEWQVSVKWDHQSFISGNTLPSEWLQKLSQCDRMLAQSIRKRCVALRRSTRATRR